MVVEFALDVVAHLGMMCKWINSIVLINRHENYNMNGVRMEDAVDVQRLGAG
jgi:hypothetical protein